MEIAIQNVGRKVTADSLNAIFSTHGPVHAVAIIDRAGDGGRGAVVTMADADAASEAILRLNGHIVDGSALVLSPVSLDQKNWLQASWTRLCCFLHRRKPFSFFKSNKKNGGN